MSGYHADGCRRLLAAILVQAGRDARRGDALARDWLAEAGPVVVDDLDISLDLAGWLADLEPVAQPALPGLDAA